MQVTRILHTSANVEGHFAESARFYAEVLGLASAPRPEIPGVDGSWYTLGETQVHLVDSMQAPSGINPTGPHVCFGVPDLASAKEELDRLGIAYFKAVQHDVMVSSKDGSGSQHHDVEQIWFTDPAGNTIELQEDPT